MLLGPLKAVLMRALQQQLSKYIHNIELEELGLLGGDVVLENLEIRKDVLQERMGIPTDYDFSRYGYVGQWTGVSSYRGCGVLVVRLYDCFTLGSTMFRGRIW